MTLPFLRRTAPARPVLVAVSTRYVRHGAGFARECRVRMPDGELVVRPVPDETLLRLGVISGAAA